jgi:parallel beta-helix repeat protein
VSTYSVSGFNFSRLTSSIVSLDSATTGINASSGFVFRNSTGDRISFNNAQLNFGNGYMLVNSTGNGFFNNSASQSTRFDYYCSPSSGGLYSNKVGVNFGISKNTCRWLVVVPALSFSPQCAAIVSPQTVTMTDDMLYPYGSTCFSVYNTANTTANATVINCNGHTVYAARGGTFVNVANSSNVKVENCFIDNFTTGIAVGGPHASVLNNTIVGANASILASRAQFPSILNNRVFNSTYGLAVVNVNYATVTNNTFYNVSTAMRFVGGSSSSVLGNNAVRGSVGMSMVNATTFILKGNSFSNMSSRGIVCNGTSTLRNNVDLGGNSCSANKGCVWMTSSPKCVPS